LVGAEPQRFHGRHESRGRLVVRRFTVSIISTIGREDRRVGRRGSFSFQHRNHVLLVSRRGARAAQLISDLAPGKVFPAGLRVGLEAAHRTQPATTRRATVTRRQRAVNTGPSRLIPTEIIVHRCHSLLHHNHHHRSAAMDEDHKKDGFFLLKLRILLEKKMTPLPATTLLLSNKQLFFFQTNNSSSFKQLSLFQIGNSSRGRKNQQRR
jgi:hypothetical protein